jgi:hypothetical protein
MSKPWPQYVLCSRFITTVSFPDAPPSIRFRSLLTSQSSFSHCPPANFQWKTLSMPQQRVVCAQSYDPCKNHFKKIGTRKGSHLNLQLIPKTCITCLIWRPHTFEIASYKLELGRSKQKSIDFDMCITSRSLVSRPVPLLMGRIVNFQLWSKVAVL